LAQRSLSAHLYAPLPSPLCYFLRKLHYINKQLFKATSLNRNNRIADKEKYVSTYMVVKDVKRLKGGYF